MLSAWATLPTEETYIARYSFSDEGYILQISDLRSIWSESLSKSKIIGKARLEKCVIDPSEDEGQYNKLLEKLEDGVLGRNDSNLDIMRNKTGSKFAVEVSTPLPKPLGVLNWEFKLTLRGEEDLKSEIIMPLIGISYNHENQITELVRLLKEKDAAISKLKDSFQGQKDHLPRHAGFQAFDERRWREQNNISDVSSISFEKLLNQAFSSGNARNVDKLANIPDSGPANRSQKPANQMMVHNENSIDEFQPQQTPSVSRESEEPSPPADNDPAPSRTENFAINEKTKVEESTQDEIGGTSAPPVIAETKPAPRKLGKIGGRATSKSVTDGALPPHEPPSTRGLRQATPANDSPSPTNSKEMRVATTPPKQPSGVNPSEAQPAKVLEPAAKDSSSEDKDEEDKANRRREQLKREMEVKTKAQPKKKRKF